MLNNATSQYDRWLKALDSGYAKVDDRSFNELMDFSVKFAGLINYYNLNDQVSGDWVDFFISDPNMIFASIAAFNYEQVDTDFLSLIQSVRNTYQPEEKFERLTESFECIVSYVALIDSWLQACQLIKDINSIQLIKQEVKSLIKNKLSVPFGYLKNYVNSAIEKDALGKKIPVNISNFLPLWSIKEQSTDQSVYIGDSFNQKIDSILSRLQDIFHELVLAINDLQGYITNRVLTVNNTQRPQIALYTAFVQLYRQAQNTINTFSQRYIDFYYNKVLHEKPNKGIGNQVFLTFTKEDDENTESVPVTKGTQFSAGINDNDEEIVYLTDKSISVTAASINKVRNLYVKKGSFYDLIDSNSSQLSILNTINEQQVFVEDIPIEEFNDATTNWPLFGQENTKGVLNLKEQNNATCQLAQLGFSVSSNYLYLSGGNRVGTINFQLLPVYYEKILNPLLDDLQQTTGIDDSIIFAKILESAFFIEASTELEWFKLASYTVEVNTNANGLIDGFNIIFILPEEAPPLVPFLTEDDDALQALLDESTNAQESELTLISLPTLKFYLNQDAVVFETIESKKINIYPLSIFSKMRVDGIKIDTCISNLTDLTITNTDGEVDTSSPFLVFGGTPVVGSYLNIYQKELFVKTPENITLEIDWFNLPTDSTGFKGYYQYYDIGPDGTIETDLFDNQTFKVSLSIVEPGYWNLKPVDSVNASYVGSNNNQLNDEGITSQESSDSIKYNINDCCLFFSKATNQTPGCDNQCIYPPVKDKSLCSDSCFQQLEVNPTENIFSEYYNPQNSAISIELINPPYAFGNDLYAKNVLNSVIDSLPDTGCCKEKCLCAYSPLEDAIQNMTSAIEFCLGGKVSDYFTCVKEKMAISELALWAAIIQCLLKCLTNYKAVIHEDKLIKIEHQLNHCIKQTVENRLETIKWCIALFKKADVELSAKSASNIASESNKQCWERCYQFYDAIKLIKNGFKCISHCQSGSDTKQSIDVDGQNASEPKEDKTLESDTSQNTNSSSQECVEQCLQNTLQQLTELYETCLTDCMNGCMDPDEKLKYPNEPYLPQAMQIALGYSASCELMEDSQLDNTQDENYFFHLLPFGGLREIDLLSHQSIQLLPSYFYEGNLYIGFSQLDFSQYINLLFLMNEKYSGELPEINWSYLFNNRWRPLTMGELDSDTTYGLENSGIVNLNLPEVNNKNNSLLEADYTWLRASVIADADKYPLVTQIIPHALTASLNELQVSLETTQKQLPAYTIDSAINDLENIQSIEQPMPSFGGRIPENERTYEVRVGERLRHKQRAIQQWDYERLVLERFPTIWKVKTLAAHNQNKENVPGEVLLVVIAGPDSLETTDPTIPQTPTHMLNQIEDYLSALMSPFIHLHVTNPNYVRVEVKSEVTFYDSNDVGSYIKRLNNELIQYLSPWFYDIERASKKGDYASPADISHFIQTRNYVKEMLSINLNYLPAENINEFEHYFLTSALEHQITSAQPEDSYEDEFCY